MTATILNIVEKVKPFPFATTDLTNFVVSEGEQVPAEIVIDNPNISLYCIDDPNQQAIFVETPPEVDLSQSPFFYDAQYQHALRLIAVPYEEFHRIADTLASPNLIMLYSVGRCGSTLISQALNTVEGVRSLSEPDMFTQIHFMAYLDRSREPDYVCLLKSCIRMLGKGTPALALKFRAMCIHIGDLLYRAAPDAHNLFLYRHQEAWARSMGLIFRTPEQRRVPMTEFPIHRRSMAPLSIPFAERHGREPSFDEFTALSWLSMMGKYRSLYDAGMPLLAVRYEDILAEPQRALAAIFDYCGLSSASVERAYEVFSRDSQEGTIWSRDNRQAMMVAPLDDEDYAQMRAVFAEQPVICSADFTVPGTWSPR